jgi:tRNA-specific 2-thiouridylase
MEWDMSELYKEQVVEEFIQSYSRGETPNPCVSCNQNIKFAALVAQARALGFEAVATGHYARILHSGDDGYQNSGVPELHRGVNVHKDQSYFVASMPPEVVQYCYFPLGEFDDKEQVRQLAKLKGFATHDKKDSSDICFLAKNAKNQFLGKHFGQKYAGNIVDEAGNIIGTHSGFWNFTIGQRQGIDVKTPRADGQPRYVLQINPESCEVVVGPKELLKFPTVTCTEVKTFSPELDLTVPLQIRAQIRAHGQPIPAQAQLQKGQLEVVAEDGHYFDSVARGQSIVLYDYQHNSRVVAKATLIGGQIARQISI